MKTLTAAEGIGLLSAYIRASLQPEENQYLGFTKFPYGNTKNILYISFVSFEEAEIAYNTIMNTYPNLGINAGFSPSFLEIVKYNHQQAQEARSPHLVWFENTSDYTGYSYTSIPK